MPMSSHLPRNHDDDAAVLAEDDIQVTSPTSYALRESIRRSSSSSFDFGAPPPAVRTPSNTERQSNRLSRGSSFFSRAPPPPPPQYPPQAPGGGFNNGMQSAPNSMARPSSNPSLAAMDAQGGSYAQHGNSLGPMSFVTTPTGGGSSNLTASYNQNSSSSSTITTTNGPSSGPGHRRSSSRRSIFSRETFMLSREKESPATIPEGVPLEIKCEGFLTKRGHVFTTWKTRYFVLRGNVLEYFSGEDKGKRYGSVTVAKVAPWSGEAHGFMFYTTKQVPYYVYASSEAERSKWLRALKEFVVEPEEVGCEGYLTRRGHLVPSQRMAYYVLNGTSLRHYADQSAYRENQSAIAEVDVRSIAPWEGEPNGLMFQTSTGNVFYASADTLGEQQKWIQTVKRSNATAPEPVSCAGYLTKQGHKRKSWKKRYFILRGNLIAYYPDYDIANSAKGKPLAEVAVEDVQKWDGEPFGFMFMTSEQVPYYVYADNDRERNKWMNALRKLTTVAEEPTVEKKRCPNCNAVLTGSRFCGACGHNLRGTTVGGDRRNQSMSGDGMDYSQDDNEMDDDNAFDELEALSEGARTLLLAVMQTPEGVDIGDRDSAFPSRVTKPKVERFPVQQKLEVQIPATQDEEDFEEEEEEEEDMHKQVVEPTVSPIAKPATPARRLTPPSINVSAIEQDDDDLSDSSSSPIMAPSPPTPPASRSKGKNAKKPDPEPRATFTPNFAIVDDGETKNSSFHSFGGDSDEESKADEPKPVPVPARKSSRSSGVLMAGMGRRKTLGQLAAESSSDEDNDTKLPTKPPTMAYAKGEEEDESKQEEASGRKSSADSLELDMGGIALMEEASSERRDPRPSIRMSERSAKKDLYHYMERELDFAPQFIPSADAPVRCRFYSSMAYASAKKVIMFISDSGPLGLWRQDLTDQTTTTDHKWAMVRYFSRAQEEGYGIIVCNPFSNSVVVYEAGGFDRVVPIPNSSTPKEHVLFVWEQFVSKCKGQVSIMAFARGGALVKSILETYETSAREKIHRVAFIESKHEIDPTESFGIRELLGSRSINWEASFEPLGGQIVDSQARVGCVCLSIGYMPDNRVESDSDPRTLEKAEDPAFAFVGANPERSGMTAVVRHVRTELRKVRKNGKTMAANNNNKQRRHSNIVILGETDANESSDLSTGDGDEKPGTPSADDKLGKPNYYLPKPIPKPAKSASPGGNNSSTSSTVASSVSSRDSGRLAVSDKDFELMKVVGQGGFGKVFLCRKTTAPHKDECYAMKVLKKQHVVSSGLVNTTMAERRILTEISHPFIVKLHYAFQSQSKLYLVMDYLSGGSLAFHLRRRRKFPEDWARFYAAEVGAAMAHLHSVNIIYRDAKLENVLMDHEGHVRITDFGLSKIGVSDLKGATTFCGTAAYIAPELLKGNAYGKAADWWSFGILLYEMIGGKPPYYHRNRDIMFQTILKQEWVTFSPNFSDAAISLIRGVRFALKLDFYMRFCMLMSIILYLNSC